MKFDVTTQTPQKTYYKRSVSCQTDLESVVPIHVRTSLRNSSHSSRSLVNYDLISSSPIQSKSPSKSPSCISLVDHVFEAVEICHFSGSYFLMEKEFFSLNRWKCQSWSVVPITRTGNPCQIIFCVPSEVASYRISSACTAGMYQRAIDCQTQ